MGLLDKKSNLDRHTRLDAGPDLELGNPVGQNPPSKGSFFTAGGQSNSPFDNEDHMKALLENKIVNSQNSGLTYDPSLMTGNKPSPEDAIDTWPDLMNEDGFQGPQFQRGKDVADQIHQSSLSVVPGPPSNSPFQDRPDSNAESSPAGYKSSGGPIDGLY